MDVSTAFLYADILEKVFVEQPPGFEAKDKDGGDLVIQLEKSLYELAQSPGNWFHTIDPVLVEIGFPAQIRHVRILVRPRRCPDLPNPLC